MARPKREGLTYFPHDVDTSSDRRLEYIEAIYGVVGYGIYFKLLERIYNNGYFIKWSERDSAVFASKINVDYEKVKEIIESLIEEGLFSAEIFKQHGILTSAGIQNRYFNGVKKRAHVKIKEEYDLIGVSAEETIVSVDKTNFIEEKNAQSKINETRLNQIRLNKTIHEDDVKAVQIISDHRRSINSSLKQPDFYEFESWSDLFCQFRKTEAIESLKILEVLDKALKNDFWRSKILKPEDFFRHWERLLVLPDSDNNEYNVNELLNI